MKREKTTIAGKEVSLAYCFATEIGYKILAEEDISVFLGEASAAIEQKRMPDLKKTICLIFAAINACSDYDDESAAISEKDIMHDATPAEMANALGTILALCNEFYRQPAGEPEDKPTEDEGKNA